MALQRLQKLLAQAGIASRRAAEQLIAAGRVRVNSRIITELGTRADPHHDRIEVDGRRIVGERPAYYLMHKPREVITTLADPEGRPTIADLLQRIPERVFPVGRLDFHTSGALLLTNDGDMAQALLHPRKHVPKTYIAKVGGELSLAALQALREGVLLDGNERTRKSETFVINVENGNTWLQITITEGKNRQVHRMVEAIGHRVMRLSRASFAGLDTEGMRPGEIRPLTNTEINKLKRNYVTPSKQDESDRKKAARHAAWEASMSGQGDDEENELEDSEIEESEIEESEIETSKDDPGEFESEAERIAFEERPTTVLVAPPAAAAREPSPPAVGFPVAKALRRTEAGGNKLPRRDPKTPPREFKEPARDAKPPRRDAREFKEPRREVKPPRFEPRDTKEPRRDAQPPRRDAHEYKDPRRAAKSPRFGARDLNASPRDGKPPRRDARDFKPPRRDEKPPRFEVRDQSPRRGPKPPFRGARDQVDPRRDGKPPRRDFKQPRNDAKQHLRDVQTREDLRRDLKRPDRKFSDPRRDAKPPRRDARDPIDPRRDAKPPRRDAKPPRRDARDPIAFRRDAKRPFRDKRDPLERRRDRKSPARDQRDPIDPRRDAKSPRRDQRAPIDLRRDAKPPRYDAERRQHAGPKPPFRDTKSPRRRPSPGRGKRR